MKIRKSIVGSVLALFFIIASLVISQPKEAYAKPIVICRGDESVCATVGDITIWGDAIIIQ